jgi:hypothetical protein
LAGKDAIIRTATEQIIDQSLIGSPAQRRAAETVLRVWKDQHGGLAATARQLVSRLELSVDHPSSSDAGALPRGTVADLLTPLITDPELSEEDRSIIDALLESLKKVRILPAGAPMESTIKLLNEVPVDRSLIDACLTRAAIRNLLSVAIMDGSKRTWTGSAELRNVLRSWLQRRYQAERLLELTPFLPRSSEDT